MLTTNEDAIWDFIKPLLPMVKLDVKTPASYANTYLKCTQGDLYDAYKDLCLLVQDRREDIRLHGKKSQPIPHVKGQFSLHQFFTPKPKIVSPPSSTSASKTQQQAIALDDHEDDEDDNDNMGSAGMATSAVIRKVVHDKGTSSKVATKRHTSPQEIVEHEDDNDVEADDGSTWRVNDLNRIKRTKR